eukprot:gene8863-biopygen3166
MGFSSGANGTNGGLHPLPFLPPPPPRGAGRNDAGRGPDADRAPSDLKKRVRTWRGVVSPKGRMQLDSPEGGVAEKEGLGTCLSIFRRRAPRPDLQGAWEYFCSEYQAGLSACARTTAESVPKVPSNVNGPELLDPSRKSG